MSHLQISSEFGKTFQHCQKELGIKRTKPIQKTKNKTTFTQFAKQVMLQNSDQALA